MYQPQSALTGLAFYQDNKDIYVLLQARVEPGNTGIAQYGPTIQSTPANYLRLHGGKATSYASLFTAYHPIASSLGHSIQLDLGKRYYQKSKTHNYLLLNEMVDTEQNMIWVPISVILEVAQKDNFLNADLRSLLSVFDWDLFMGHSVTTKGNTLPIDLVNTGIGHNNWDFVPLGLLNKWDNSDDGIEDISSTGIWVDMFQITCTNREVKGWHQPLLCCGDLGLVVLYFREINGDVEFLVTSGREFGISGENTVLPSFLSYPGETGEELLHAKRSGQLYASITQCDEGGRFLQSDSLYEVRKVDHDFIKEDNQYWISAQGLKAILKLSCKASFQLRCISSLVLELINPLAFKGTLHLSEDAVEEL